jgi:DNA-binding FrmR family transcriptional regulator
MKTAEQRINNIIGQLGGAKKMLVDQRRDCFAVIIQLKASRAALDAVIEGVVATEFSHCLREKKTGQRQKMEKIFKEIIKK